MDIRSLGILMLKFWGLVSLVWGVTSMINLLLVFVGPIGQSDLTAIGYGIMSNGLAALLTVLLGVILLARAQGIVTLILPNPSVPGESYSYTAVDLESVVFGGLGVYFAINALRDIGTLVYAIAYRPEWEEEGRLLGALETHQAQLAGAAVQLVVAVILLIRRNELARLWSRIRPMVSAGGDSSNTEA